MGMREEIWKMRIMFWNTHKNIDINEYVVNLIRDYDIDVFVMAEYCSDEIELKALFEKNCMKFVPCYTEGCGRIVVWSNYARIEPGCQNTYHSIQIIKDQYILCCVHLMSDLHGDRSDERFEKIQEIMYDIKLTEQSINSQQTMIVGDFNEMPYDKGCLNANGFHGLPVLGMMDPPTRRVYGTDYRKFYNPMWNFMGDFTYPPGTYYLNQSRLNSPMWYMLDQVIVSREILPLFKRESLRIITSCSYSDLRDEHQCPNINISDHFPIMCEIEDQ